MPGDARSAQEGAIFYLTAQTLLCARLRSKESNATLCAPTAKLFTICSGLKTLRKESLSREIHSFFNSLIL